MLNRTRFSSIDEQNENVPFTVVRPLCGVGDILPIRRNGRPFQRRVACQNSRSAIRKRDHHYLAGFVARLAEVDETAAVRAPSTGLNPFSCVQHTRPGCRSSRCDDAKLVVLGRLQHRPGIGNVTTIGRKDGKLCEIGRLLPCAFAGEPPVRAGRHIAQCEVAGFPVDEAEEPPVGRGRPHRVGVRPDRARGASLVRDPRLTEHIEGGARVSDRFRLIGVLAKDLFVDGLRLRLAQLSVRVCEADKRLCGDHLVRTGTLDDCLVIGDRRLQIAGYSFLLDRPLQLHGKILRHERRQQQQDDYGRDR